jgi:hypothetical protein
MSKMRFVLICLTFFLTAVTVAQTPKSFEGEITFKLEITGGGDETALARQFMPTGFIYVLKDNNVLIKTRSANAAMMGDVVYNAKTDRAFVIQEAMKTIYLIKADEKSAEMAEDANKLIRLSVGTESKTIAGYFCKHYIFSMGDEEGSQTEIWVAEDIKVVMPNSLGNNMPIDHKLMSMVKGFPLAMKMVGSDGLIIEMVAEKIEKMAVKNSVFDMPKDYEIKTFEPTMKNPGGGK